MTLTRVWFSFLVAAALTVGLVLCEKARAQVVPGSPNMTTGQVTVTSAATLIVPAHPGRASVVVVNDGTTDVFVGGAGVTATTGVRIPGSSAIPVPLAFQGALYGITATGSDVVSAAELF